MNNILTVEKRNHSFNTKKHIHPNWEIIFCLSGGGTILIDNQETVYQKNDIVIICPNTSHTNRSKLGFTNIRLSMDNLSISIDQILKVTDTGNKIFGHCLSDIYFFYNSSIPNKDIVLQNLGDLLTSYIVSFSEIKRYSHVIEKLRNSMMRHFSESHLDLNLMFGLETQYNPNYLKKLFKKEVGISPQQFLINLRISHAKKLLTDKQEEHLAISQVAYNCGYDDALYFSRVFKSATGFSPKEYQKNNA